jgi:hypothetical protein
MATIERGDLVKAVLQSRDELDPVLDTQLLEDIVNAEADAAGDGDSAIRAIDAVVTGAVARGVGHIQRGPGMEGADVAGGTKDGR